MSEPSQLAAQENLIRLLVGALEQAGATVELIETHISWVLVAGAYAYKIKKAVRFDFLDFSTLDARRFFCLEEVRLNRRLAPALYLDVVTVRGSQAQPRFSGGGPPLEYAVRMRAFAQQALWSRRIEAGQLGADEVDQLAAVLESFHRRADVAPPTSHWGTPQVLQQVADDNLALLAALAGPDEAGGVGALRGWQAAQQARLRGTFLRRKADGRVRNCHGDLHCANIVTVDGRVEVFDCIEFSESLRWTDVMSDLAFVSMDLLARGLPALAARLLNGYLMRSGDYEGLAVLRYYQIEAAQVRWKVLRLREPRADGAAPSARYRQFALQSMAPAPAALLILHGVSGSGKSTVAGALVELLGAVQVRADVERKRMQGLAPFGPAAAGEAAAGLYGPAATQASYARLRLLAAAIVRAGMPALVDATFLQRQQRQLFRTLADALGVPFFIIDLRAGEATLRARVAARARAGGDPSDADAAVLAHQLAHREPLSGDERALALSLDTGADWDAATLRALCRPVLAALGR
ncbi:AAA family ATPase [Janthinobacterium fluminis]|uniref:AAA family ATPase n=1 Tax=Janthinobacterium fluminis TaxID=2987524 RepID=A0ABT5JVB7_9BURK|nr:bifunctional aminoglycoside phosphotransferase/ATP-binding protein [Janthinobacterium fluminis]MDC8756680.1 AAA family ATPase [Janthinobacterium fluminis]